MEKNPGMFIKNLNLFSTDMDILDDMGVE